MALNKILKRIRFSLVIVPEGSSAKVRPKTINFNKVILIIVSYTLIFAALLTTVIILTPIKSVIFSQEMRLNSTANKTIIELDKRVNYLLSELEMITENNERLKNAILLGDSTLKETLFQDMEIEPDTTESEMPPGELGGSLLPIVEKFYGNDEKDSVKKEEESDILFMQPITGYVSKVFNAEMGHMGVDYTVKSGSPVMAAASGYVVFSDFTVDNGNVLILSHSDNYISIYKHCAALLKKEREYVMQGEIVALSGNTGKHTTGPHLHFELWKDGRALDPKQLLLNY